MSEGPGGGPERELGRKGAAAGLAGTHGRGRALSPLFQLLRGHVWRRGQRLWGESSTAAKQGGTQSRIDPLNGGTLWGSLTQQSWLPPATLRVGVKASRLGTFTRY